MTNVQNNLKLLKLRLLIFLALGIQLPLFSQHLSAEWEMSLLALGDSCTKGDLRNSERSCFDDDSADFKQIKEIFYQQEEDWNRGDIEAFMSAYWNSENLQFGGAHGITRGWQNTLERYKSAYPDRASMGTLSFQIKDITRHSSQVVSLTGSWELRRANDRPGGHFLLIWRKIEGEWKIAVDHTSQKLSP